MWDVAFGIILAVVIIVCSVTALLLICGCIYSAYEHIRFRRAWGRGPGRHGIPLPWDAPVYRDDTPTPRR